MKLSVSLIAAACAILLALVSAQTIYTNDRHGFRTEFCHDQSGSYGCLRKYGHGDHWPASNPHPVHTIYSEFDPPASDPSRRYVELYVLIPGHMVFPRPPFPQFQRNDHCGGGVWRDKLGNLAVAASVTLGGHPSCVHSLHSGSRSHQELTDPGHVSFATTNPSAADVDVLYTDWKFPCSDHDFSCASGVFIKITAMMAHEGRSRIPQALFSKTKSIFRIPDDLIISSHTE